MDTMTDVERMHDYLADRMSPDAASEFESRLVREPTLVQELELALKLRTGLAELSSRGRLQSLLGASHRKRTFWIPLAAAAAIVGVAVSLWQLRSTSPPVLSASLGTGGGAGAVSARYTFRAMRGAAGRVALDLPVGGMVEFAVAPGPDATVTRFDETLRKIGPNGERTTVAELDGLATSPDGLVHSFAPSVRLSPGAFELTVAPTGAPRAAAQDFEFQLVESAPAR